LKRSGRQVKRWQPTEGNLSSVVDGNPTILLVDEPTRGIDVGAKYEIYTLMDALLRNGIGIVMVSSELPEVLAMSDRILVMREGRLAKEFDNQGLTEEIIMEYATGSE